MRPGPSSSRHETVRNRGYSFTRLTFAEQIDVCTPGSTVVIRNAKIEMFKGFMRLSVDKWGSVKLAPEAAKFEVNQKNDLSAVEYELVVEPAM